jgi:hypothetical protein
MIISWKTDGSEGSTDLMAGRVDAGTNSQYYEDKYGKTYAQWAEENGRVNFKAEMVGSDFVITEEWNIDRADYDALDIEPVSSANLPMVETTEHLSF